MLGLCLLIAAEANVVVNSATTYSNTDFYGNSQFQGDGGQFAHTGEVLTVLECNFRAFYVYRNGGAIYSANAGELHVEGGIFEKCEAQGGAGGAVYVEGTLTCVLKRVTVTGCFASGKGGAFYVDGQTITIQRCKVTGCDGAAMASAIYINVRQDGVSYPATGTLTCEENTIENDRDGKEYNVYPYMNCYPANVPDEPYYGQWCSAIFLVFRNCTFDNHGKTLESQFVFLQQYILKITMDNCVFQNIQVPRSGAAINQISTQGEDTWQKEGANGMFSLVCSNCRFLICIAGRMG